MSKVKYLGRAFTLFYALKNFKLTSSHLSEAEQKSANLKESGGDVRLLIDMAKDTLAGRYKMGKWNMSVIAATIAYVIMPVDAIPDIILGVGWLDDITIVTFALSRLRKEADRYMKFKAARQVAAIK